MVGRVQVHVRCPKCDEYPHRRLSDFAFSCSEHGVFRFLPQPNAPGFTFDGESVLHASHVYEPFWLPRSSE